MFCPKNETFQNITEKTKLLAQKCSQQIRIAAAAATATASTTTTPHHQQPQQYRQQQISSPILQLCQSSPQLQANYPNSAIYLNNIATTAVANDHQGDENFRNNSLCKSLEVIDDSNYDVYAAAATTAAADDDDDDEYLRIEGVSATFESDNENYSNNSNNHISSLNKFGSNIRNFCTYTGGTLRSLKKKYRDGISSVVNGSSSAVAAGCGVNNINCISVNGHTHTTTNNCTCSSNGLLADGSNSTVKWYVKPTWRLWGEEREKDAIFTVYLKKVRYHRPTPSANHDSDDEISHLEWETVRVRFVKAATLARLVDALATDDGELESTFINVFLSTYRTFSNPKQVLDLLIKRYDSLTDLIHNDEQTINHNHYNHTTNTSTTSHNNDLTKFTNLDSSTTSTNDSVMTIHEQHKKTLVSALHVWLDGFPEDWNEETLKYILAFSSKRLSHSELHLKVLHRLEICLRMQVQHHQHNNYTIGNNHHAHHAHHQQQQQYSGFAEQFTGLCLAPAFRGPPSHLLNAYRFPHVPVKHFAEQLTRMDMELFKRLIPHQCLGATWARRDKHEAETVVATVTQFNAVSYRVISSILIEPRLKPQERALHITTWIDIAQELRLLKNFSSLKAIISGLQSNAIYRLSKTWAALPKEKMEIFTELARIFSEENNAWAQREVLMREGTAKFADTVGENDRHLQKAFQKQNTHTSHGTIPYLGTFLTDLTMIHAAIPDTVNGKLINFDKKRKEFEVLAQIKLLQGAANTYNLRDDHHFDRWFASMLVLDEREAHTLSCQLEIPPEPRKMNPILGHRKTDSIASNSSSGAGSQFYCEIQNSNGNSNGSTNISFDGGGGTTTNSSRNNSLDRDVMPLNSSILSASSSVSNLSIDSSNSGGQKQQIHNKLSISNGKISTTGAVTHNGTPIINAQLVQSPTNKNTSTPAFYIIRVTYETDNIELDGIVLYKSIMLGNNERTPQVIRNAMMKLDLDGDPDRFTLAQVLPDKELVMPPSANVYYAVNTMYNLNFILRPKRDGLSKDHK